MLQAADKLDDRVRFQPGCDHGARSFATKRCNGVWNQATLRCLDPVERLHIAINAWVAPTLIIYGSSNPRPSSTSRSSAFNFFTAQISTCFGRELAT